MWQRMKNFGFVTGLGGHFATWVCKHTGVFCDKPPKTKRYHEVIRLIIAARKPRQRVCISRRRQRLVTEGGPATTRGFDPQPYYYMHIYIYIYIYIYSCAPVYMRVYTHIYIYIYIYIHTYVCAYAYICVYI